MIEMAIALRPKLLLRALELYGRRDADAEDAVGDMYLAFCRKPPVSRTPAQLHHCLRTVLMNQRNQKLRNHFRDTGDLEVVSLDALRGWTG
jgi:DNA-directed RNA polymerase specialized sigma24 family protein